LTILGFPPGQHIQVSVLLDRQREVLIKLLGGLLDVHIGAKGKSKKELDAPFAASVLSAFVVNEGEGVVTPVVVGVGVGATGFQLASHTAFSEPSADSFSSSRLVLRRPEVVVLEAWVEECGDVELHALLRRHLLKPALLKVVVQQLARRTHVGIHLCRALAACSHCCPAGFHGK